MYMEFIQLFFVLFYTNLHNWIAFQFWGLILMDGFYFAGTTRTKNDIIKTVFPILIGTHIIIASDNLRNGRRETEPQK